MTKTKEYKLGSYRGNVGKAKCWYCGEVKPSRFEPSLGRFVRYCKPCLAKIKMVD